MRARTSLLLLALILGVGFGQSLWAETESDSEARPAADDSKETIVVSMSLLDELLFDDAAESAASPFLPPGHGGTPPGQGGTPPGQTTPPGQGGTPPGQGGTAPGQGGGPPPGERD